MWQFDNNVSCDQHSASKKDEIGDRTQTSSLVATTFSFSFFSNLFLNSRMAAAYFLLSLFSLTFAAGISAQDENLSQADPEDESSSTTSEPEVSTRPLEEIVVVGQQTLFNLKHKLYDAEDDIFRLFNEINSSDDMDVVCLRERQLGSHLIQRICEPAFLRRVRSENARDFRMGFSILFTPPDLNNAVNFEMKQLRSEMDSLIGANAEYAKALGDYAIMVEDYNAQHDMLFKKD